MKFRDVMAYYDYKMKKVIKELKVGRLTVVEWKKTDSVPFDKQCVLEIKSEGLLKANREDE